ncbi:Lipopolysaccharide ABC transporter, ATP-binding protein LptB [Minicystis rosea]|nr:Lipopolysaccharide ABC transporter, ATP-binding protein LptB [Minicystis rosea]
MSEIALSAEGIGVRLGGTIVLRDVCLEVAAGEVLGVFGPSGAGKSTLFRALAGEERVASGCVRLAGEDVTALPLWQRARRGLGYVPQTPSVLWDLTVAENLAAFRRLAPRPAGPTPEPAALLADLGLDGRASVRASSLSGGERRRLELGRALSAAPRVLLCDEPFAAIDPLGAERAGALLRRAAQAGAAVVLADHHVEEALRLCDRAALLLGGEVAVIAPPPDFLGLPLVRKHYAAGGAAAPGSARSSE